MIHAAGLRHEVSEQERRHFLNPMRYFSTNEQMVILEEKMQEGLAIIFWGNDLDLMTRLLLQQESSRESWPRCGSIIMHVCHRTMEILRKDLPIPCYWDRQRYVIGGCYRGSLACRSDITLTEQCLPRTWRGIDRESPGPVGLSPTFCVNASRDTCRSSPKQRGGETEIMCYITSTTIHLLSRKPGDAFLRVVIWRMAV